MPTREAYETAISELRVAGLRYTPRLRAPEAQRQLVAVWDRVLSGLSDDRFLAAVRRHLSLCTDWPSPGELRRHATDLAYQAAMRASVPGPTSDTLSREECAAELRAIADKLDPDGSGRAAASRGRFDRDGEPGRSLQPAFGGDPTAEAEARRERLERDERTYRLIRRECEVPGSVTREEIESETFTGETGEAPPF